MHDGLALTIWALLWASVGTAFGLVLAALMLAGGRADDAMTYEEGFKAGYDQATYDADFSREIEQAALSRMSLSQ